MIHGPRYFGIDESGSLNRKRCSVLVAVFSDKKEDFRKQEYLEKERGNSIITASNFNYVFLTGETLEAAKNIFDPEENTEWNGQCTEYKLRAFSSAYLLASGGFEPIFSKAMIDSYCDSGTLNQEITFYLGRFLGSKVPPDTIICKPKADLRCPLVHRADEVANHILRQSRKAAKNGVIEYLSRKFPGKKRDMSSRQLQELYNNYGTIKSCSENHENPWNR